MKKIIYIILVVFLLTSCVHEDEVSASPVRVLSSEEITEAIEKYPETKTFAGGFYYGADLNDDGDDEIYILPWGSGVPIIHQLNYYDPSTNTFGTYESDGKAFWYFIYDSNLYAASPNDEYMMIYDNIESVYIPYLENGELKLQRADEDIEKEILKSDLGKIIPMYGVWDE